MTKTSGGSEMKDLANDIAAAINLMPNFRARAWTKVDGKERVYVEFGPKNNGGRHRHGGVGWCAYYDVNSNTWRDESWAGARTRKAYEGAVDLMVCAVSDLNDSRSDICPDCNGSGEGMTDLSRCGTCRGSGEVTR